VDNMSERLKILKRLEVEREFYRRSLNRVSKDFTKENYDVFKADSKVMSELERELHSEEEKIREREIEKER